MAEKKTSSGTRSRAKSGTKAKVKTRTKAKAGTKTRAKAKTKAKTKAKAKVKTKAKPRAGTKARAKTRTKAKTKTKTKVKAKAKAGSKPKAGTKARAGAAPKAGKKLSRKELEEARALIQAERVRIIRELGRIEETISDATQGQEGSNQSYSNHLADIGTDYMEQEKNFYYASQEGHYLRALDEALERIERGEYGLCELCHVPIGEKRLRAVPSARLCIKCKSESEKSQRGR